MARSSLGRRRLRRLGLGTSAIALPSGLVGIARPELGSILIVAAEAVALAVFLMVLMTAIFGSDRVSERVFRLLRMAMGRPEPDAPVTLGTELPGLARPSKPSDR